MQGTVYQARMELLRALKLPPNHREARALRIRHRLKLALWEFNLRSLFVVKRGMDIAVALAGLVLLLPVFLLVAAAILLEDGWPVSYVQDRVGLNGRVFRLYKFRSMARGADRQQAALAAHNESADGVLFKMRRDPRVTRVGRVLRRFSLDELPQLVNVLKGDLALVGPRPPLPREVAAYSLDDRKRLHAKPGLTCFWQIQGRSEIPFKEQVRLDLQYIHSQSLWKDLGILARTIPAVLLGRGAY